MKKTLKTIAKVILVLVISAIFFVGIVVGGISWKWISDDNAKFSLLKFDREEWLKHDGIGQCIRGAMYDDLTQNYLKKGMSKDEVLELIGEPRIGRIYHRFYGDKKCFKYLMGDCKWVPRGDTLLVCFNTNERVNDFFRSDDFDSGKAMYLYELNLKE
jgi:hypothetical protein